MSNVTVTQAMRSAIGQQALNEDWHLSLAVHVEATGRWPTREQISEMKRAPTIEASLALVTDENPQAPVLRKLGASMIARRESLRAKYGSAAA